MRSQGRRQTAARPGVLALNKVEASGLSRDRLADDRHEMGLLVLPVTEIPAVDTHDTRHVLPRPRGTADRLVLSAQISIAPGLDSAPRTPGRTGEPTSAERGYYHCGPNGAGHFVKIVHNGIEYGLMAAYAEGLNIIKNADAGLRQRESDAETAPLEEPQYYQYQIDTTEVAEVWRPGSVVSSWLLDLSAAALQKSPDLAEFAGRVSDSGEGRWTSVAAIDTGVPAPVLTTALYSRFASRGLDEFSDRLLSAMRMQFGGHEEKQA